MTSLSNTIISFITNSSRNATTVMNDVLTSATESTTDVLTSATENMAKTKYYYEPSILELLLADENGSVPIAITIVSLLFLIVSVGITVICIFANNKHMFCRKEFGACAIIETLFIAFAGMTAGSLALTYQAIANVSDTNSTGISLTWIASLFFLFLLSIALFKCNT